MIARNLVPRRIVHALLRQITLQSAAALTAALFAGSAGAHAQGFASSERGAAVLGSTLNSLGNTSRVLVIGAHPDDEDTQLIAWLARGRHVETAYLSLTRGDGGQNLIGNDLSEALGVIRTEELQTARRIDGGRQFFTRAYDFGFSKNAEETLQHWPIDTVMGDVIKVVRAFRPQVIVAIFSGTPTDGHGHHQVSGILARRAYDASADTVKYPVAEYGLPWSTSKFYRRIRNANTPATRMNVGEYDALVGRSFAEIAADSRSQHRSQGFGMLLPKGAVIDQVGLEASRVSDVANSATEGSILAGVDTTWARLGALSSVPLVKVLLDSANAAFVEARLVYRASDPTPTIAPLARAVRLLRIAQDSAGERPLRLLTTDVRSGAMLVDARGIPRRPNAPRNAAAATWDPYADAELWNAINVNLQRAERALVLAAGVAVEAYASSQTIPVTSASKPDVPDTMLVNIAVHNRGRTTIQFWGVASNRREAPAAVTVLPDSSVRVARTTRQPVLTMPWWRAIRREGDIFFTPVDSRDEAERAQALAVTARVALEIAGVPVVLTAPVVNRFADPVKGEQRINVAGVPGIIIGIDRPLEYIRANAPVTRLFRVQIQSAYAQPETVSVSLQLPNGIKPDSASRTRVLTPEAPTAIVTFTIKGQLAPDRYAVHAIATHRGIPTQEGYSTIAYDHINVQRVQTVSSMWLTSVDALVRPRVHVAYIPGVGDVGYEALTQLDVKAERIEPSAVATTDFSRFTTVVVGPRAYASSEALMANNSRLLQFAKNGGTLVVQYGQGEMMLPGIMPYPIQLARSAERVTMENANVTVLSPTARLLNTPNKIRKNDWDGWVQERALYMPSSFDRNYTPLLEMNDPNESPNKGGLLVANYGRGTYVYVTLALFRQLPNGVPGAARLLLNLISATPAAPPRL